MTGKPPNNKASLLVVAYSSPFLKIILVIFLLTVGIASICFLMLIGKSEVYPTQIGSESHKISKTNMNSTISKQGNITNSPENSPPAPRTESIGSKQFVTSMGDTLVGYYYVITVDEVAHSPSFTNYLSAKQDNTLLALHVVMESQSETGVEVNPRYWRLYDDQNPSFPEVGAGKDPSLVTNRTLIKGEKLQGWITFEIPKDIMRFKLAYNVPNIPEEVSFVFDVGYGY